MAPAKRTVTLAWLVLGLTLAAQEKLPDGKGKQTLENTCTECHGLDKALGQPRTEQGWRNIAKEMRSRGATMSDAELNDLVEYLFRHFGTDEKPTEKINVNKASAQELEAFLQLTASESAAVIHYRETNGPFKEWRDLTKVDRIDKSKIEARKEQLTF